MTVTLKQGDCLELMKNISDGSIDMILCDLPYGTTKCKWDSIIPFDKLWAQYKRVLKSSGVAILTGVEPFSSALIMSNAENFVEKLTWIKHKPSNFMAAKYRHMKYTEDIIVFKRDKKDKAYTFNKQKILRTNERIRQAQKGKSKQRTGGSIVSCKTKFKSREWSEYDADFKNPIDYIQIPGIVNNSKEKVDHPTQKPVRLLEYLIKTYSNEGETVLDNCMGSGSTGVAAIKLKRNFIGIELDKEYFDIAKQRIDEKLLSNESFLYAKK